MANIKSVDGKYNIQIPDNLIIRVDEFVSIEIKDMNWHTHLQSCRDCKEFNDSFFSNRLDWIFEFNSKKYTIDKNDFGSLDYSNNYNSFIISNTFYGTKLKFKISKIDLSKIETEIKESQVSENYEHCQDLLNIKNFVYKDISFIKFYLRSVYNESIENYFGVNKTTVSNWKKRGLPKKYISKFIENEKSDNINDLFNKIYKI